ncbi:hypothetical protein CU097_011177 [Rhizopus azygosporus]|uniref:Uncharacterized protein n=1 Tax=Rhizopus azygosporus TaxID=86630 RepID=A0A367K1M2_RHIAZ|nr:hypothetical protein CU097_011177 [Rhizopus azygosporus]
MNLSLLVEINMVSKVVIVVENMVFGYIMLSLGLMLIYDKQVKISLLENGRCFLEKLADHAALLNSVHLPLRKEVEAFDGDTITIGAEQKIILRLPNSKEPVYHITVCEDEPLNAKEE